jgi:hypothetical protein
MTGPGSSINEFVMCAFAWSTNPMSKHVYGVRLSLIPEREQIISDICCIAVEGYIY